MRLYLMRHGIAQERDLRIPDGERALTPKGKKRVRKVARALIRLGITPDLVWTSPLTRARQTAEVLAKELRITDRLKECQDLAPAAPCGKVLDRIRSLAKQPESILLVGHQPDLGELAAKLVFGSGDISFPMRKGGLCCLEAIALGERWHGEISWLLHPRHLWAIADEK